MRLCSHCIQIRGERKKKQTHISKCSICEIPLSVARSNKNVWRWRRKTNSTVFEDIYINSLNMQQIHVIRVWKKSNDYSSSIGQWLVASIVSWIFLLALSVHDTYSNITQCRKHWKPSRHKQKKYTHTSKKRRTNRKRTANEEVISLFSSCVFTRPFLSYLNNFHWIYFFLSIGYVQRPKRTQLVKYRN